MNIRGSLDVLKDVRTNAENSLNSTEAGLATPGSNDRSPLAAAGSTRVRFDRYVLDGQRGCLLAGDEEITLRPKTFEFLRYLASNPGRLVSKDELLAAVWPNVVVSDDSLFQCVTELRRALQDHDQHLIKTVQRRGYRFEAALSVEPPVTVAQPVDATVLSATDDERPSSLSEPSSTGRARRAPMLAAICALGMLMVALGASWWWFGLRDHPATALPRSIVPADVVAQGGSILQATLAEPNLKTAEVSTADLQRILADGSGIVLDTRTRAEFAMSHIPGAQHLAREPGAPPSQYVSAIERLVGGDKSKLLVLYCNGRFCTASRSLSDQLLAAGFTDVRRYQVGIQVWRAIGGPTEIELEALARVFKLDGTAVFLDARNTEEFSAGSLSRARNIPLASLGADGLRNTKYEELLPREDFNTRIMVFGTDSSQARALAEAIFQRAFQNVTYFPGNFDILRKAIK
jgi:DNA-binding winged helix-turn-helix (wHTH) protein/rhodanese-related sulfurtransferase